MPPRQAQRQEASRLPQDFINAIRDVPEMIARVLGSPFPGIGRAAERLMARLEVILVEIQFKNDSENVISAAPLLDVLASHKDTFLVSLLKLLANATRAVPLDAVHFYPFVSRCVEILAVYWAHATSPALAAASPAARDALLRTLLAVASHASREHRLYAPELLAALVDSCVMEQQARLLLALRPPTPLSETDSAARAFAREKWLGAVTSLYALPGDFVQPRVTQLLLPPDADADVADRLHHHATVLMTGPCLQCCALALGLSALLQLQGAALPPHIALDIGLRVGDLSAASAAYHAARHQAGQAPDAAAAAALAAAWASLYSASGSTGPRPSRSGVLPAPAHVGTGWQALLLTMSCLPDDNRPFGASGSFGVVLDARIAAAAAGRWWRQLSLLLRYGLGCAKRCVDLDLTRLLTRRLEQLHDPEPPEAGLPPLCGGLRAELSVGGLLPDLLESVFRRSAQCDTQGAHSRLVCELGRVLHGRVLVLQWLLATAPAREAASLVVTLGKLLRRTTVGALTGNSCAPAVKALCQEALECWRCAAEFFGQQAECPPPAAESLLQGPAGPEAAETHAESDLSAVLQRAYASERMLAVAALMQLQSGLRAHGTLCLVDAESPAHTGLARAVANACVAYAALAPQEWQAWAAEDGEPWAACLAEGDCEAERPLKACGGCGGAAVYCCRACQVAHWRAGHKEACGQAPKGIVD
eukprot:XP_001691144.1 chlamydomonas-specific family protein [Chlamydomonas reinhardtii]